jgi:propionyl-CoA carboxylase beta chain
MSQEHGGIIRHGAKLLYAYCEATVPKLTVITRKAYGGAYDVMSSQAHPRRLNLAWPPRRSPVMGPRARWRSSTRTRSPSATIPTPRCAPHRRIHRTFRQSLQGAARGFIDDVIDPRDTRPRLIDGLRMLATKRDANPEEEARNIPL